MKNIPRILITPGEPAGVGPDITVKIAQQDWPAELVVVGDPELLISRAKQLDLPLTISVITSEAWQSKRPTVSPSSMECHASLAMTQARQHIPGTLKVLPINLKVPSQAGKASTENAEYVLQCLELATDLCLQGDAQALVTGPVNKGIMNDAGIAFTGHTEFLANRCHAAEVIMLFVADKIKVALATTHLPLSQVPKAITADKLFSILRLLHAELQNRFAIKNPKILVCGLNPHAGENGHLGREEIETIIPTLEQLRRENINAIGPLPADTIFTEKYLNEADAILAMYHDQALPVVKYLGFGHAVNVTLGLPIIRTSVDHGTAFDVAGTQQADAGSMEAALRLAIQLI